MCAKVGENLNCIFDGLREAARIRCARAQNLNGGLSKDLKLSRSIGSIFILMMYLVHFPNYLTKQIFYLQ